LVTRLRKSSGLLGSSSGFTLVELSITVLILGVIIGLGILSYTNISRGMAMSAARKQVEAALERAKASARQENVTYVLIFYSEADAAHPNTYEFRNRVEESGSWVERSVDRSVSGEEVIREGDSFYVKVTSGVKVASTVGVTFSPRGTEMAVTPATVTLRIGNRNARVSIDAAGKVTTG